MLVALPVSAAELVFESEDLRLQVPVEHLTEVSVTRDLDDRWAVRFRMNARDSAAFGKMTTASVGKALSISVCGEVVIQPIVQSPIFGGIGQIGVASKQEADTLALTLKGREPCNEDRGE